MKKSSWKSFFSLLHQARLPCFSILFYTVLSLMGSQLYLLFPSYTQHIMAGNISRRIIVMVILIVLVDSMLTSVKQFVLAVTSAKVTLNLRKLIWRQVLWLPSSFFDRTPPGGLISRVTDDTTKLGDMAATFPGNTISAVYEFTGSFLILFSYHWKLAAVEAVMIPLVYLIGVWQGRVQFSWNNRIQESMAKLTASLAEILQNLLLVKSFVKEERERKRGETWIHRLFQVKFQSALINNLLAQAGGLARVCHTVLMIWAGIWLSSRGEITIDIWIAFYMYAQGLMNSFSRIMSIWGTLKTSQGSVRRLTELMAEEKEDGFVSSKGEELPYENGDIVFENVSFGYETDSSRNISAEKSYILKNMSITIPGGKTTALIGPSGSGKTTIFQLLERLYQPDEGWIRVGNTRLSDISLDTWRKSVGYVSQNPFLFSGTIRENILYGIHRTVTEEAFCRAVEQAQVAEFLNQLPEGLETQIGEEGNKLSGGQRQRVAIARIMLQEPKLILLDEATSSLDIQSEMMVERALRCLKQGRTTVVIAHKMTAVKGADQIIVLKEGRVDTVGKEERMRR